MFSKQEHRFSFTKTLGKIRITDILNVIGKQHRITRNWNDVADRSDLIRELETSPTRKFCSSGKKTKYLRV